DAESTDIYMMKAGAAAGEALADLALKTIRPSQAEAIATIGDSHCDSVVSSMLKDGVPREHVETWAQWFNIAFTDRINNALKAIARGATAGSQLVYQLFSSRDSIEPRDNSSPQD